MEPNLSRKIAKGNYCIYECILKHIFYQEKYTNLKSLLRKIQNKCVKLVNC